MATYFRDLVSQTTTRVWVNNPSRVELMLALEQGAVGCTTNPAFAGGLLRRAREEVEDLIREAAASEPGDERAAQQVQERLVGAILPRFAELHEKSSGVYGLVSLQGSPALDGDASAIVAQARAARALGPNCIAKIPATAAGLSAFEVLVAEGQQTLVTEVFSLAQVIEACNRYRQVVNDRAVQPVFMIAPITGIFGDHLRKVAARDAIDVDPAAIEYAGVIFARAAARLVLERGYAVTLLFGGARTTLDLTGLVGSRHQSTVNWSTFAEVLATQEPVRQTIDAPAPAGVRELLAATFEDVRRALDPEALTVEQFESFGPVDHFRSYFLAGWRTLLEAIGAARLVPEAVE
jgi:transaldolase